MPTLSKVVQSPEGRGGGPDAWARGHAVVGPAARGPAAGVEEAASGEGRADGDDPSGAIRCNADAANGPSKRKGAEQPGIKRRRPLIEGRERMPAPEFGEGWTMLVVPRPRGTSSDKYFFSPSGRKFRSRVEVRRYLATGEVPGRRERMPKGKGASKGKHGGKGVSKGGRCAPRAASANIPVAFDVTGGKRPSDAEGAPIETCRPQSMFHFRPHLQQMAFQPMAFQQRVANMPLVTRDTNNWGLDVRIPPMPPQLFQPYFGMGAAFPGFVGVEGPSGAAGYLPPAPPGPRPARGTSRGPGRTVDASVETDGRGEAAGREVNKWRVEATACSADGCRDRAWIGKFCPTHGSYMIL